MDRQLHIKLAACAASFLASWLHCQVCNGQDAAETASESTTPQKIVVLKDGGVLVGSTTRDGDRYLVARAGGEIQVASTNVLFVCNSLEEAYELRRTKFERADATSHLRLADWCLRYNLVSQADRELADARELEPLNPRLALLQRRLVAASDPQTPSARPAISTAVHTAAAASTKDPSKATTRNDKLPPGTLERFTRKVQPILVNNCTTSGCHQPGGPQEFQLDRSLLHGQGNRRTTMRNLTATLSLIDHGQPHLSPLLTVLRETHGGMDRPIFGPRQESAFTHLVDWVAIVSNSHAADDEASSSDTEIKVAAYDEATTTVADTKPSGSENVPPTLEADDVKTSPVPVRYGAQLRFWQPKDPFDPEIFNRAQRSRPEKNSEPPPAEIMGPNFRE